MSSKSTRAFVAAVLAATAACDEVRRLQLTFGTQGEGLDGFLCRDSSGSLLMNRLQTPEGTVPTNLVVDFIHLGGLPGCRSGQVVRWCADHPCSSLPNKRVCLPFEAPDVRGLTRAQARQAVLQAMNTLAGTAVTQDAPDEFVLVRVVGTTQACDEVLPPVGSEAAPNLREDGLFGCAYSCPVLLDAVDGEVYLGFETLTEACEQGVRICASGDLHWQGP